MAKEKLAVIIDGGLGRVICAIPALQELASKKELIVLAGGWFDAYKGSGLNVLPSGLPSTVDSLNGYKVVKPEPYWELGYRNGELNLVEAFYIALGLKPPVDAIPFHVDTRHVPGVINAPLPVLVLQPFGSGGQGDSRSMTMKEINQVIDEYHTHYSVFVVGKDLPELDPGKCVPVKDIKDSQFIKYVQNAALFIGCDSAGLHIAAASSNRLKAYVSTTSGIKYYPNVELIVREGFEDMRVNPRL